MNLRSISLIFSNRIFKYNSPFFLLLLACFFTLFYTYSPLADISVSDLDPVCKPIEDKENKENVFCFFSLNSPDEQVKLEEIYGKVDGVKVEEFYGETPDKKSVQERYRDMLRTQKCDYIIHSGHSVGYMAGDKSIETDGEWNSDWKLDLDFLEDMSCEPGCEEWFSNVKGVFLMGCQTVKTDHEYTRNPGHDKEGKDYVDEYSPDGTEYKTADSENIRVSVTYDVNANDAHSLVNQAFSSTLDVNDKLSHRFLGMYPNASIFGWGGSAPGERAHSEYSLPKFIEWVRGVGKNYQYQFPETQYRAALAKGTQDKIFDPQSIIDFVSFMNQPHPVCREHIVGTSVWVRHWDVGTVPTACYLSGDQEFMQNFKEYHRQGCELSRALKSNNGKGDAQAIQSSLDEILGSGDSIKANFNRLMSLVIDRGNHKKDWYPSVIDKLKGEEGESNLFRNTLIAQIKSDRVGFARKSDYIYFYNKMGWEESKEDISVRFLNQLEGVFSKVAETVSKAVEGAKTEEERTRKTIVAQSLHRSVLDSVIDNDLQLFLFQNAPDDYKDFIGHVEDQYPELKGATEPPYPKGDLRRSIYWAVRSVRKPL